MKYSFFIFCLLAVFNSARAQQATVSGDFSNTTFPAFVQQVESNLHYRFYYDPSELDSFKINVVLQNQSLNDALLKIFDTSRFRFSVDAMNHVFITRNTKIQTGIPADFYDLSKASDVPDTADRQEDAEKNKKPAPLLSQNKLYEIGTLANTKKGKPVITGFVKDAKNGEALPAASIYLDNKFTGILTDQFGYYSLTVPPGLHTLEFASFGMKGARRNVLVYTDGKLNIDMVDDVPSLKNIVITAEKKSNVKSPLMGVERLSIKSIKLVPVVFGEADILRVVLTLPGVTSVGEAGSGFNVRGGSADQNLILFDGATVYNPSHLLGFFSAFNPEVVKGVELYKSVVPVKFGGRLSSVLDVSTKDGNDKKITGTGGVGLLTSKLTIEGPIKKDKTSFVLGGRTSYSNWLLGLIPNSAYSDASAAFYDANLHITHTINAKNSLYLTGYLSHDNFRFAKDTTYKYGNKNAILKWKHIFNYKLYGIFSAGTDHYQYSVSSTSNPVNSYKLSYNINQTSVKGDITYTPNNAHSFNVGFSTIYYKLHPGSYLPYSTQSEVHPDILPAEQALESAVYLGYQYNVSSALSLNAGIRYSVYNYLGPHDSYNYVPGLPKETGTIQDTTSYAAGKIIKTYQAPEYRLSLRYTLPGDASIKAGYNTLQQYIHILSNTITISPTDIWKLSDANIKPQSGQQFSIGYYKNFNNNTIETSIETYYKLLDHMIDYKSGASLLLNHHIETDLINSKGKAYGVEVLVKKLTGKLNGWISYTWSRTLLKSDDATAGETVNKGKYYPASYDKPNNVNFIGNYKFSHRINLSLNVVYSTGRPITLPIAVFNSGGAPRLLYSDRNQYRIPDYFRSDLSMNMDGNHKIKQLAHNSWSLGVYNLFARKNVYSAFFVSENGTVKGYQLSIFGTAIPFISYNFRF